MLKYALAAFAVPPGLFVLAAACAGFLLVRRRKGAGGAILIALAATLWLLSTSPVSDSLLREIEERYPLPADPRGDAIILLGGGVRDGAPDPTGEGIPSGETLGRMVAALRLQKRLGVPVIVSGGAVFEGRKAEAPIIRRLLVDLGAPPRQVIVEDASRDTAGNAGASWAICRKMGLRRPVLVTSAFHMPRAVLLFSRAGAAVVPFPAPFRTWPAKEYVWADWLPSAAALNDAATALREYLALIVYRNVPGWA